MWKLELSTVIDLLMTKLILNLTNARILIQQLFSRIHHYPGNHNENILWESGQMIRIMTAQCGSGWEIFIFFFNSQSFLQKI